MGIRVFGKKAGGDRKRAIIRLMETLTPKGGRILEISCADGRHLVPLQEKGFLIQGTNYSRYNDEVPGLPIDHGVDLIKGLPYADGTFDTVALLDVIEHLSDHDRAVAEMSRVCREGGHVIVLSPNASKLTSRLQFLLTGFFKLKRDFVGFDVPKDRSFTFHNYPPHLPTFLYQMHTHGLPLHAFSAAGYKARSFLAWIVFFPLVAVSTWLKVHVSEPNLKGTPAAGQVMKCLSSFAGLCGEFWIVVGRRAVVREECRTALPPWAERWKPADKAAG